MEEGETELFMSNEIITFAEKLSHFLLLDDYAVDERDYLLFVNYLRVISPKIQPIFGKMKTKGLAIFDREVLCNN